jgi:DNA polymerase III epsilon subunit-like protein
MSNKYLAWNNRNLLCAVDCETSGLEAGYHDLIQICVLPVGTDFRPLQEIRPFYMDLAPKRPENFDQTSSSVTRQQLVDCMERGIDPYKAADYFDEWFKKLNLGYEKRIMVLGHNWPFDRGFLIDWLGPKSVEFYFDGRFRDTMAAAQLINDRVGYAEDRALHSKLSLSALADYYGIPHDNAHNALSDCLTTLAVYREMVLRNEV